MPAHRDSDRFPLDAISSVFVWGMERDIVDENPCDGLRAVLRRKNRTERGRAESERERANPIEKPEDVAAFVIAAETEGGANYLATLLMLDAGLRLGEATALDWRDVEWHRRTLHVRQSLSRGKHLGPTKSGRSRSVALSPTPEEAARGVA
jgi:integrase